MKPSDALLIDRNDVGLLADMPSQAPLPGARTSFVVSSSSFVPPSASSPAPTTMPVSSSGWSISVDTTATLHIGNLQFRRPVISRRSPRPWSKNENRSHRPSSESSRASSSPA